VASRSTHEERRERREDNREERREKKEKRSRSEVSVVDKSELKRAGEDEATRTTYQK
jgi:hypothetical protein